MVVLPVLYSGSFPRFRVRTRWRIIRRIHEDETAATAGREPNVASQPSHDEARRCR